MTQLNDYAGLYRNIAMERRDAVLQLCLHTGGGPLHWGANPGSIHGQLGDAFHRIAHDPENRAVILTGSGNAFCEAMNMEELPAPGEPGLWRRITQEGRELLLNFLDIPVPVVAAVNGPALIHAELPLLADIVLVATSTQFADLAHFTQGVVPGDGAHVIWPALLGPNRARHFLLMGQMIGADEARQLGLAAEVLEPGALQARAWEIAGQLAAKPVQVLHGTRALFTAPIRRRLLEDLDAGFAAEGLGFQAS